VITLAGIHDITAFRVMLHVTEMVIHLTFEGVLDDHLRQPAPQPALAGEYHPPARAPLGQLPQQLLIRRGRTSSWSWSVVPSITGISLSVRSYTVENYSQAPADISVP
jgi:hypothetical protein